MRSGSGQRSDVLSRPRRGSEAHGLDPRRLRDRGRARPGAWSPALPGRLPAEPVVMVGPYVGLTSAEMQVAEHLAAAYNAFTQLPGSRVAEMPEFVPPFRVLPYIVL